MEHEIGQGAARNPHFGQKYQHDQKERVGTYDAYGTYGSYLDVQDRDGRTERGSNYHRTHFFADLSGLKTPHADHFWEREPRDDPLQNQRLCDSLTSELFNS